MHTEPQHCISLAQTLNCGSIALSLVCSFDAEVRKIKGVAVWPTLCVTQQQSVCLQFLCFLYFFQFLCLHYFFPFLVFSPNFPLVLGSGCVADTLCQQQCISTQHIYVLCFHQCVSTSCVFIPFLMFSLNVFLFLVFPFYIFLFYGTQYLGPTLATGSVFSLLLFPLNLFHFLCFDLMCFYFFCFHSMCFYFLFPFCIFLLFMVADTWGPLQQQAVCFNYSISKVV